MTTIVMNTRTTAVTEYDWEFNSITSTHAASADGLFALGGDDDNGEDIAAAWLGPKLKTSNGETRRPDAVFVGVRGDTGSTGKVRVVVGGKGAVEDTEYTYDVTVQASGISKALPGQGIRENYIAYGYENVSGADFSISHYQADEIISKQRRAT